MVDSVPAYVVPEEWLCPFLRPGSTGRVPEDPIQEIFPLLFRQHTSAFDVVRSRHKRFSAP